MPRYMVYHGSYLEITQPEIIPDRHTKDFGPGFYCTILHEQAKRWTTRYKKRVINLYDYRSNDNLKLLEFRDMTEEWLDFIIACRSGVPHDYDIVIGAMADDQVWNAIEDYLEGIYTREQFWMLSKFKYPTHQINFCSQQALDCLTFKKSEVFPHDR